MKQYSFLIECDNSKCNYWMSFACWYSIKKNIPNSEIYLNKNLFKWARKADVKFKIKKTNFDLVLSPSTVAVRSTFDDKENLVLSVSSSKSEVFSTFVDYKYGCGKLKISDTPPFEDVFKKYLDDEMSINEKAVLNIFQKCSTLYKALEGCV